MSEMNKKEALAIIKEMAGAKQDEREQAALCTAANVLISAISKENRLQEEPDDGLLHEYTVRLILSELTIHAYNKERAEEIAQEISNADARTQLNHNYGIEGIETVYEGTSDQEEETETN